MKPCAIGGKVFSGNIVMNSGGAVPAARPQRDSGPQAGVLVLCTANVCRSPMATPLLARRLDWLGGTGPVRSAGMLGDGMPPDPAAVTVMADYGIEIASHRSRAVRPDD